MTFLRSLIFIVMFASFHVSLSVTSYNPIPNNATALRNNLSMWNKVHKVYGSKSLYN